ncbi:50S ribosomal protein L18 [Granulosicoccus sp.]|jgi:large subunit ribosomal protein L18|nr:50S ribosomal protein L18 [Granulosicoccus sp.]MDB4224424.1 50S ribosomal protein L18 [Granulosicoccus sp.]
MDKKTNRLRRAKRTRAKIRELCVPRLTVHRTPRHIYAQVIDSTGLAVVATASSVGKDLRSSLTNGGNVDAATSVGKSIAEKAVAAGISEVAFDRSGFKYHGRVKALAEAARENGLKF